MEAYMLFIDTLSFILSIVLFATTGYWIYRLATPYLFPKKQVDYDAVVDTFLKEL